MLGSTGWIGSGPPSSKKSPVFTARLLSMDAVLGTEPEPAHSPKVPEDDLYDPPLDDADYHSADEPQSGAATPTMHSPMVPTRPPWRSRLHPQGVNQSFEFDHVEGAPPTRSTRPPTGSTTMTASEGAASSPLSDHSGAPRRSAKKQSAFARAQADSRRAFKYYDTPIEEHLLDDVARRRRAMQSRATPNRQQQQPPSQQESWDGSIPAHYGSGGRHPVARRRLASPAKSIGGQSAASSPSQRQWVLKPLESNADSQPAATPNKRWRVVRWLGVAALGAAAVAVGVNPGVQAQLCVAAVHVARAVATAGRRLEGATRVAAGALAGAAHTALHNTNGGGPRRQAVLRDVPPTELRRHLLIEEQQLTLRMLRDKEAAEAGPSVGQVVSAQLDALKGAARSAAAGMQAAAAASGEAVDKAVRAAGKAVDKQRKAAVGVAVAAAHMLDVRPALRWAAAAAGGPLRAARRRREMRRMREAAWAAARRKRVAGVDLLHHTARNPDGLLPEQRLRVPATPARCHHLR